MKFRAFLPPSTESTLSVSRLHGLSEAEIWQLGDADVAAEGGRTIYARANFSPGMLADVRANGSALSMVPAEPPVRHANVIGWPSNEHKEIRKGLAQQLAAKTSIFHRPG